MTVLIDLSWSMAAFLLTILILVIGHWLLYTRNGADLERTKYSDVMRQCYYCNFVFFDFKKKDLVRCPRCQSYLERTRQRTEKTQERDKKG